MDSRGRGGGGGRGRGRGGAGGRGRGGVDRGPQDRYPPRDGGASRPDRQTWAPVNPRSAPSTPATTSSTPREPGGGMNSA